MAAKEKATTIEVVGPAGRVVIEKHQLAKYQKDGYELAPKLPAKKAKKKPAKKATRKKTRK